MSGVWGCYESRPGLESGTPKSFSKALVSAKKIRAVLPIAFIYLGFSGCQRTQCYNYWDLPKQASMSERVPTFDVQLARIPKISLFGS